MKGTENKQSHGITFVQSSSSKTLLAVKLVAAAVTLLDIGRHHIQGAMFWIGQTGPAVLDGTGAGHASRLSLCQPEFLLHSFATQLPVLQLLVLPCRHH